jgi:hypothetical protein
MARGRREIKLLLVDALASRKRKKETDMNFTGTSTLPRLGRHISRQLLTLVVGLSLAATAVIAVGALGSGEPQTAGPQDVAAPISSVPAAAVTQTILFVVSSEEAKIALERGIFEESLTPGVARSVLVASSPEDESAVITAQGEAIGTGTFEVVDLRGK